MRHWRGRVAGFFAGLLLGGWLIATPAAQSYVWGAVNGLPFGPGLLLAASGYLNWGTTAGDSGYGLRDSGGEIQAKGSGGIWVNVSASSAPTATSTVVGPYDSVVSSGATLTNGGTAGVYREFFQAGQKYRVRQRGTITSINLYIESPAKLTSLVFKVWRGTSAAATLVGTSGEMVSLVGTASAVKTLTLPSPIAVEEGDFYGIRFAESDATVIFQGKASTGATLYYKTNVADQASGSDWTSGSLSVADFALPILMYSPLAPQVVAIGDSITAGHPQHYSFLEATTTTDLDGHYPYWTGNVLSATYQNMGIGGESTTAVGARFATDVVALGPRVVIIHAGVNDLNSGVTQTTHVANFRTMLNRARAANIIPVIVKMLPWTGGTTTGTTSGDGAVDGTTVVRAALTDGANYYVNWWVTVGSETRQVTAYDGTATLTVSPAFSGQVASGTAIVLTSMTERDLRWEAVATLARAYPDAVLVDLDYTMGQTNANGPAGNLWDLKTAYTADGAHPNAAGAEAMGRAIAAAIQRKLQ